MSKKHQTSQLNNENMDDLSAPPGFVSLTSFILKRVGKIEEANNSKEFLDSSTRKPTYLDSMSGVNDNAMLKKTLRQIPRIIIDPANHNSEVSDSEHCHMVILLLMPNILFRMQHYLFSTAKIPLLQYGLVC